jgi:hypothetical protein
MSDENEGAVDEGYEDGGEEGCGEKMLALL